MKNRNLLVVFTLCVAFSQVKLSLSADQASSVVQPNNLVNFHDFSAKDYTRGKRQISAVRPGGNGSPVIHRPSFYLNNASAVGISPSIELASSLVSVDTSFGVHQIALLNSPTSIQDVEAALQGAWWASNVAISVVGPSILSVKILIFRDYGMFSDKGLPVIDVTYFVGLNRSNVPASFDVSKITLRLPDIPTLAGQLSSKNLQLCDCDIFEGYLLHLVGIVSFMPNISSYNSALQTAWITTAPELICPSCVVDIQFARTVITIGATGVRLTTAPYVVLLNGHVWLASSEKQPLPSLVENTLVSQRLPVHVYRGSDTPTYAALTFVSYLNANIQFQDIAAVQRTVQSYLVRALPKPSLQVTIWNLEPFLNPQASVITQSSYFLTTAANGIILDPRLFYAPPLIDVMANQTDGNITTVTGGTLGVFPLYLIGHIQANQLRSVAEILKITYAESNRGLNPDEVDVAIVSLDDGVSFSQTRRQPGDLASVTELHVSAMVNSVDPDSLPHLTPFHQLLSNADLQDALNSRLKAFNTAVCKDCQFRKLRSLNLLQVDPTTSTIPDAQAVLDKILLAWIASNPQSAAWLPLDVSLVSRDDSLANENGTLVSQLTYSVGYPLPAFTWYIPRDPDNRTLEQQLSLIKAVPFFGAPLYPQQIVLSRQMTAQDQPIFAASAMRAWAEDKDDLHHCQQANANCFVAVVDPENPTVTMINGSPQYLYKYYMLVDDKVYVPSESLSPAQQVRLRSALDSTNTAGGVMMLPFAPVIASRSTTVPTLLAVTTQSSGSLPQGGLFGNSFNLSDSINLAVSTERQRNRVLEQITLIWQAALQSNVTNIQISTLRDVSGFPNPETVDGRPIRTVTYLLQGTGSGAPVDLNLAVKRFRQLLSGAGIPAVLAANPEMTTAIPTTTSRNAPPFVVLFDKTLINATTLASNSSPVYVQSSTAFPTAPSSSGIIIAQILPVQSDSSTTSSITSTNGSTGKSTPLLLLTPPIVVGPGPFVINDTIVVTADTRRSRDRVLEEQIRPVWQTVLGGNVTSFQLGVVRDSAFSTPQTPGGTNIRQIQYQVQGVAKTALESEEAKQQFRQVITANGPRSIWAISNNNGSVILLPNLSNETSSATAPSTTITFITTAVPVSGSLMNNTAASFVPLELVPSTKFDPDGQYLGSLTMRSYNPSDQEAVIQTLQQLWTQALETNDSNVLVKYLPASGNSNVLSADGSSLFDLRYALTTKPNVTRPDKAWSRFLSLLRQSDLMDFISQLPVQAPQNVVSTTSSSVLSQTAVIVIPVLSFTEKQDISISDPSDIWNVADGLRVLWANASGINASASEIRIINVTPLDPPKTSSAGLPVQTLTYGVTLQNVTDLPSVRARAEALVPNSFLKQYLILPEQQTANGNATTTKSSVILLVPAQTDRTTTDLSLVSTTLAPVLLRATLQQPAIHSFDGFLTSGQDVALVSENLRTLWAQAYGVPVQSVNLTVKNVTPISGGSPDRTVARIQYSVEVPGKVETGQVQESFQQLLAQSSLASIVIPTPITPPRTAHSLRIAVSNVTEMDQLTNGIRNGWIAALDMQGQPQVVLITLTNVQPENVATRAGVPISTLFYDLQVPPNLQVGPDQEAAFLRLLLQSPARLYVTTNDSSTPSPATTIITGIQPEKSTVPFSISDTIILATNSRNNRDRILGQVKKTWDTTLAPNASNLQMNLVNDFAFTTPTTSDGVPIRSISYQITGQSNSPVDEYDVKSRFRQLAKTSPISGVQSIPDLPAAATTPLSELPSEVVILTAAASTTIQPDTAETSTNPHNNSLTIVPVVIPLKAVMTSTTPIPAVPYTHFLHLKRPVGPLDEATIRQLIAEAWADQNNQSASEVSVHLLSTDAVVDDQGILGSNVTYGLTGPPQMAPPSLESEKKILGGNGWPVCRNCFAIPVHSFYLTTEGDDKVMDPLVLREAIRQAVIVSNPEVAPNTIQTAFPQNSPIQQSNEVSNSGQDLLLLSYFAADRDQLLQLREPSMDHLQRQFTVQTVYPISSPSVVRPVRLLVHNKGGSWTDGTSQPLDGDVAQQVERAVNSAVESSAKKHSLNCSTAQLLKSKNLYGRFGRHYTEMLFELSNVNGSCSNLPVDIINEISQNAQNALNHSSVDLPAISTLLPNPSEATDPSRVYHHDYQGKLNIFDLQKQKADLVTGWLQANPNCVQFNCSYSTQILATQRRLSVPDGSDITRVYYTIHSLSQYAVYPPQQMQPSDVASRAVQKVTFFPGSQSDQQLQALIGNSSGNNVTPSSGTGVRRKRQSPDSSLLLTDVNARYCFDPQRHLYVQYRQADVVSNGLKNMDAVTLLSNGKSEVQAWNQSESCKGCICDIPVYLVLIRGHANATSAAEQAELAQTLLQPWLSRYANVTQDLTSISASSWSGYVLGNPEYKYHDASGTPLTLVRYGVQVAGAAPSQLLIPDLTRSELETFATYPICTACAPQLDQSLYLGNVAPGSLTNVTAALNDVLLQQWALINPTLPQLQVHDVALNNDNILYTLLSNESLDAGPLQRLDYVVALTPDTNWTSLETLQEPTTRDLTVAFSKALDNSNISLFSANAVRQIPDRLTMKTELATATPHWLPAAIIIPLAGVIALTLLVVCLITRASRLFRSKKTVVITDPSMIQTIGTESPFKEGNGKPNMAFDDYRNVGRQDISKV